MEEIDKEISEMKLAVNARARECAMEYLKRVCIIFTFISFNLSYLYYSYRYNFFIHVIFMVKVNHCCISNF